MAKVLPPLLLLLLSAGHLQAGETKGTPVHLSRKVSTLVFIRKQQQVLLGMKKDGLGVGRWTGFGGKVEIGETIEEAAKRELEEESSLRTDSLQKVGLLLIEFAASTLFTGEPRETEEMRPKWFPLEHIPYDSMWPGSEQWFPVFLGGAKFVAYFKYKDHDTILLRATYENWTHYHGDVP